MLQALLKILIITLVLVGGIVIVTIPLAFLMNYISEKLEERKRKNGK